MKLVAWISETLSAFDATRANQSADDPARSGNPVLLVHGIYSTSRDMARLAGHLRRLGRTVHLIDLHPNCGRAGIDELAGQVAAYVEKHLPAGRFDLVGFSMGGLVSRYYVQRLGGADRVENFVTLAAPHHGTFMALFNRSAGGTHMRRGSAFLIDLERDEEQLGKVKFTSFYTPLDLMIVPARSSMLPQSRNVRIWAWLHPSLILEKRCLRAISEALGCGCESIKIDNSQRLGETRIPKPETRINSQ